MTISILNSSTIISLIVTILLIFKTLRYKYLLKIVTVIIILYKNSKLLIQIGNKLMLLEFTIIIILYYHTRQLNQLFESNK